MHEFESDYKSTMFYDVIRYAFKTDKYLWSTEWDDDEDYYDDDYDEILLVNKEVSPLPEKSTNAIEDELVCNDDYDAHGNIIYY